ncbi:hypothetical protein C8J56DRAFT_1056569 [Mycena floridula]|nr:hypothetical protein C8J56DRAFT_1056569 [Mycena floridula]
MLEKFVRTSAEKLVITDTTFRLPKTPSHQLVDLTLQFMCFEFNGTQGTEIALFSTLNFLAECTALEVCSVRLQNAHSQGVESVKPFRMERLRSLCFHLYGSSRHGTPVGTISLLLVLDLLTLPALQELDVRFGAGSGSLSDALEQLLVRSETASLRKLSLHFYVAPTTSPINSLRLSPELTDFKTYTNITLL